MTNRYWPLLLTLAALWGASYLFIKVGVDGGFSPGALMAARTLLAGLRFLPHERTGPARIAGVCLGLVGVAFVAGGTPQGGAMAVIGTLAVVLASVFYASAGIYSQLHLKGTISGPVLATGSMLA